MCIALKAILMCAYDGHVQAGPPKTYQTPVHAMGRQTTNAPRQMTSLFSSCEGSDLRERCCCAMPLCLIIHTRIMQLFTGILFSTGMGIAFKHVSAVAQSESGGR